MPPKDSFHIIKAISRYFRILFSVFICLTLAAMISGILTGETGEHFTHSAAKPLYALTWLGLTYLSVVFVLSLILFCLDRLALWRGPLSMKVSFFLVTILFAGSMLRQDSILGFFCLLLLLYYCMTGRIAGRPGWSLAKGARISWDEILYLAFVAFLVIGPASTLARNAYDALQPWDLGTPPFQVRNDHELDIGQKLALRRFPDAQSCLQKDAEATRPADLVRMNWDKINTRADAKTCVFRLLQASGGLEQAADWFTSQGLDTGSAAFDTPYVGRNGTLRVSAGWSIRANGPRFPTKGLIRRILSAIPYEMSIYATYSADGSTLLFVYVGYSTL